MILIIEDSPSDAAIIADIVKRAGFTPLVASSATDMMRHVHNPKIKMIICDIGIPDLLSPVALIDALKHGKHKSIVHTGSIDPYVLNQVYEAGLPVVKNGDRKALQTKIEELLDETDVRPDAVDGGDSSRPANQ